MIPELFIEQAGAQFLRLWWPSLHPIEDLVDWVDVEEWSPEMEGQIPISDAGRINRLVTFAGEAFIRNNEHFVGPGIPSERRGFALAIRMKDGTTIRTEVVVFDPLAADFSPYRPEIVRLEHVGNGALSMEWLAFARFPAVPGEVSLVTPGNPFRGRFVDTSVTYEIFVSDSWEDMARMTIPLMTVTPSDLASSQRISPVQPEPYPIVYDPTWQLWPFDFITRYQALTDTGVEIREIRGNRVYYVRIRTVREPRIPQLRRSTWAYGCVYVPPLASPAHTLIVSQQLGTLPHGSPATVNFNITSTNISAGIYYASVENLPVGVSMRSTGVPGNPDQPPFRVEIKADGTGQLQLVGSSSTIAGIFNNLTLTLYDSNGNPFVTSEYFTLTISVPPGQTGGGNQGGGGHLASPIINVATAASIPVNGGIVQISLRVTDNQATITLAESQRNQIINAADEMVSFDFSGVDGLEATVMSSSDWNIFADAGLGIEIIMPTGTLAFDATAVTSIGEKTLGANIASHISNVEPAALSEKQQNVLNENDMIFKIMVMAQGQNVTEFDGILTVAVSFDGELPASVWHLTEDGTLEQIHITTFNVKTSMIEFEINRLCSSLFVIRQNESAPSVLRFAIGSTEFTNNGVSAFNDVAPFIDPATNRTMIPVRTIAEALGATVTWNETTRTVHIIHNNVSASLIIDTPLPGSMGTVVILNGRTFAPLRYVSEILGTDIRWDEENKAVYIYK
jgi:hypothetical protein